ncbi:DUF7321 family protein [Halorussus litoreus]|uniref:DUF7321 family protein n=1 Tax=Halorussus litoreus TaxID=1710536 RepID=UPI000E2268B2|nr:hypothetical protein [Halorussus litoreus]
MVSDALVATVVALLVTASFPFYLYGAWYILDQEVVTWDVLIHHLKFIAVGLVLTTGPMLTWMAPRFLDQIGGLSALHVFLGLQAYAMLILALTGIVRIFQVKRGHDLYEQDATERDVDIDELHENMGAWRGRLRIGVAGYVVFWLLAWLVGVVRYLNKYVLYG